MGEEKRTSNSTFSSSCIRVLEDLTGVLPKTIKRNLLKRKKSSRFFFTFDWKSFSSAVSDLDDLLLLLLLMNADYYLDVHSAYLYWILTPFPILLLLLDRYHWSNDVDDDYHYSHVFLQLVDVLRSMLRRVSNVFSIELEQNVKIQRENYCIDFYYNFV